MLTTEQIDEIRKNLTMVEQRLETGNAFTTGTIERLYIKDIKLLLTDVFMSGNFAKTGKDDLQNLVRGTGLEHVFNFK